MNLGNQWCQQKDQPGLFTLYFQDSLLPVQSSPRHNPSFRKRQKCRRFKSEFKIASKYHIKKHQCNLSNTFTSLPPAKHLLSPPKIQNLKTARCKTNLVNTNQSIQSWVVTSQLVKLQKAQLKLKVNNLSNDFDYGITRQKKKALMFESNQASLISTLTKKQTNFQEARGKCRDQQGNRDSKTKVSKIACTKKAINSDKDKNGVFGCNPPLLEYLVHFSVGERRQEEREKKKNLNLFNLITFNNPTGNKHIIKKKSKK